jgi:hypothetical protein
MNTKNLLTSVGAALMALMLVACVTPVGTVYKYKYEGKSLTGRFMIVHLDFHDSPDDTYVEYSTGSVMDFCNSGKLRATKSIDGDLKIFTIISKNTCDQVRFVVRTDGNSHREEFNGSTWQKIGGVYKTRG